MKYLRVYIRGKSFSFGLIPSISFQISDINNAILEVSDPLDFLRLNNLAGRNNLWLLLHTRLTLVPIVSLNVILKFEQILLYLQLLANFNS